MLLFFRISGSLSQYNILYISLPLTLSHFSSQIFSVTYYLLCFNVGKLVWGKIGVPENIVQKNIAKKI